MKRFQKIMVVPGQESLGSRHAVLERLRLPMRPSWSAPWTTSRARSAEISTARSSNWPPAWPGKSWESIPSLIIGNTAEAVLRRVECSVLTVQPDGLLSPVNPV